MPTYRRRGTNWRAEIARAGQRESATFPTKAKAEAWAKARERDIMAGQAGPGLRRPLRDALLRYSDHVSPTKRGARWERIRLAGMARDAVADVLLAELVAPHIAAWRDRRLAQVSGASVAREFNLLRSVLEVARREWQWIRDNPCKEVRKPAARPPRTRRISDDEAGRIVRAMGYEGGEPENASQRAALAFLFAIETAMRAGEICGLTWDAVREKSVVLPRTKNGDQREVPLSMEARRIVGLLPRTGARVFDVAGGSLDVLFRRGRDKAGITGLRFHDSRAEACTRLAKRLDVLDLARMIGHRDLRSLRIYYRATADEIADRLG